MARGGFGADRQNKLKDRIKKGEHMPGKLWNCQEEATSRMKALTSRWPAEKDELERRVGSKRKEG